MTARQDDMIRPFQVEATGVRGRLVRLGPAIDDIVARHKYPDPVSHLLSETVLLACLLGGAVKFDGMLSVQAKGDGPVSLLVADFVAPGTVRAYAQFDEAAFAGESDWPEHSAPHIPAILGNGYLAFTVDPKEEEKRYQGIVPLEGATLSECAHQYFRDSEQIETAVRLATGFQTSGKDAPRVMRGGGIMVQRLPEGDPAMLARGVEYNRDIWEDDWRRAVMLLATATDGDLLAPDVSADDTLFLLYHEDGVRVFDEMPVRFGCRCSADRPRQIFMQLSAEELDDLIVDGQLYAVCEFCSTTYHYSPEDIRAEIAGRV